MSAPRGARPFPATAPTDHKGAPAVPKPHRPLCLVQHVLCADELLEEDKGSHHTSVSCFAPWVTFYWNSWVLCFFIPCLDLILDWVYGPEQ